MNLLKKTVVDVIASASAVNFIQSIKLQNLPSSVRIHFCMLVQLKDMGGRIVNAFSVSEKKSKREKREREREKRGLRR